MKTVWSIGAIIGIVFLTGCASNKIAEPNPYQDAREKFAPWEPYAISTDRVVHLVEPRTQKQVSPGVYRVWVKKANEQYMRQEIVDCNSEESLVLQIVAFKDGKAQEPLKFPDWKFSKINNIPGTVGAGYLKYICKGGY